MTTERRRDGDLVDQHEDAAVPVPFHDPRCGAGGPGWLPPTVDERPVPCTVCRPHVARTQDQLLRQRLRPHRRATAQTQAAAMAEIRVQLDQARRRRTGGAA